jgi:hypothetical protein
MTAMTGRGGAKLEGEELRGLIVIHLGDESDLTAKRAPSRHNASWYCSVRWSPLYSWPNSLRRRRSTSPVAPCSNPLWPSRSKLRSSRPDPTTRHHRSSPTWRAVPTESARQMGCNRTGERTDKCRQAEQGGQELRRPAPTRQPTPNEEHHEEPDVPRHLEKDRPLAAPAGSPVPGWLPLLILTGACRGLRRSTDTRGLATGCRATSASSGRCSASTSRWWGKPIRVKLLMSGLGLVWVDEGTDPCNQVFLRL